MARTPHHLRLFVARLSVAAFTCAMVAARAQDVELRFARDGRGAPSVETTTIGGSRVEPVARVGLLADDDAPPAPPAEILRASRRKQVGANPQSADSPIRESKEASALKPMLIDGLVRPAQHVVADDERTSNDKPAPTGKAIPLAKRSQRRADADRPARAPVERSLIQMGMSLAVVCGLVVATGALFRRTGGGTVGSLPQEVIETLGRASLTKGQDLQLVRVGGKLLLLCVTSTGSETLTEIADPDEVERLSTLCRQNHPKSVSAAFRDVLANLGGQPAARGFVAPDESDETRSAGAASWWQAQYRQGASHG